MTPDRDHRPEPRADRYEVAPGCWVVSTAGSGRSPPGAIRDTVRALCESADRASGRR